VAAVWRRTGFDLDNPRRTEKLLSLQPVEEIWGVGRRISKKLNTMGITSTAAGARESSIHQEEFQRGAGENRPGTQRRKLYFAGRSASAKTADSLQPEFW
jgi:DNA polymerase V